MAKRRIQFRGKFKTPLKEFDLYIDADDMDVFLLKKDQVDPLSDKEKDDVVFWGMLALEKLDDDEPVLEPDYSLLIGDDKVILRNKDDLDSEKGIKEYYIVHYC